MADESGSMALEQASEQESAELERPCGFARIGAITLQFGCNKLQKNEGYY
jgi:hypothetical protein